MRGRSPRSFMRLAAVLLAAALALLAPLRPAWAHAEFVRSDPAPGSTVDRSPATVTAYFSEEMEPAFSTMTVVDAQGRSVTAGPSHLLEGNQAMQVPLRPDLQPGVYTVRWKNLSTDGHSLSGSFTFRVAPVSGSASGGTGNAAAPAGPASPGTPANPAGSGTSGSPSAPAPSTAAAPPAGGATPARNGGTAVIWAVTGVVAAGAVALAAYRLLRR
ncbi:MAG: copper resistance protein CopC [Bacillota bacterium]|nr:copper resistance protein CopC [Bacillota bacterium]